MCPSYHHSPLIPPSSGDLPPALCGLLSRQIDSYIASTIVMYRIRKRNRFSSSKARHSSSKASAVEYGHMPRYHPRRSARLDRYPSAWTSSDTSSSSAIFSALSRENETDFYATFLSDEPIVQLSTNCQLACRFLDILSASHLHTPKFVHTHIVLNPLYHPRSGLVMNTFIHQNGSVTDRDNINNRQIHQDLHWLNIPERVSYRLCMLTHRCLLGKAPRYLSEYCVLVLMSPLPAFTIGSASPTDCTTTSTQHICPTCICCRGPYDLQRYAWSSAWSISQHYNVCVITENSPVHYLPARSAH